MYPTTRKASLDERDRAVGAILIGEALITSCERARSSRSGRPSAWRAILGDAHDDVINASPIRIAPPRGRVRRGWPSRRDTSI